VSGLKRVSGRGLLALVVLLLLLSQALIAGCQALPRFLSGIDEARRAVIRSHTVAADSILRPVLPADFGSLTLNIIWPMRPGRDLRGYHAQVIPDSTSRIDVSVLAAGTLVATGSVNRQAGEATASVTISLKASNNYTVIADAFAGGTGPIARGTAAGVNVLKGQQSRAALSMFSLYTPDISSSSVVTAQVGDSITLLGTNLAAAWAATASVNFTGGPASVSATVTLSQTGTLSVTVPGGAISGAVAVTLDGATSSIFGPLTITVPHALSFNGIDQYFPVNRPIQDDFTWEAWIKTSNNSRAGGHFYQGDGFIYADVGGPGDDFGTAILNNKFAFGTGNPDTTIQSSTTVTTGQWIHVAAVRTRSTGTIKVYVNGVLEASQATGNTSPLNSPATVTIGGNTLDSRYYKGLIDEVRAWRVARTQAEIQATMFSRLVGNEGDLAGYWRLDTGSGNQAVDSTANANHGALLNGPAWTIDSAPLTTGLGGN